MELTEDGGPKAHAHWKRRTNLRNGAVSPTSVECSRYIVGWPFFLQRVEEDRDDWHQKISRKHYFQKNKIKSSSISQRAWHEKPGNLWSIWINGTLIPPLPLVFSSNKICNSSHRLVIEKTRRTIEIGIPDVAKIKPLYLGSCPPY